MSDNVVVHLFRYDEKGQDEDDITFFSVPTDKGDDVFISMNFLLTCIRESFFYGSNGFISCVGTYDNVDTAKEAVGDTYLLDCCDYSDYCHFKNNDPMCKKYLKK